MYSESIHVHIFAYVFKHCFLSPCVSPYLRSTHTVAQSPYRMVLAFSVLASSFPPDKYNE